MADKLVRRWRRILKGRRKRRAVLSRSISRLRGTVMRRVARLRRGKRPRIVDAKLRPSAVFGSLGPEVWVTGHHTAGPTDTSVKDALRLCRVYHDQHAAQGWGGIGYHFCLPRAGGIILLRPVSQKGAHVGGWNSGNVGVMCHGTTGDYPTAAQRRAFEWLLANAHTDRMPASHRTTRDLRRAGRRGHNDWPGHESNACPGTHKPMFVG